MFFCSRKFWGSRIIFLLRLFFIIQWYLITRRYIHVFLFDLAFILILIVSLLCCVTWPCVRFVIPCVWFWIAIPLWDTKKGLYLWEDQVLLERQGGRGGSNGLHMMCNLGNLMHAAVSGIIWLHMSFDWMPILSCSCMSHYNAQH